MENITQLIDTEALTSALLYDSHNPLLFNTCAFMLIFLLFLAIYRMMRRHHTVKMVFVILFSLYFYYKNSAECCFILMGVCVSDYLLGRWMGCAGQRWVKRSIVAINVIVNVGMLVYFKYFNLLYETIANIIGTHFDALDIILPAGISFFTFRSISYIVDIYRGKMTPVHNFLDYAFFLTFFPPLLAGPVVRARDLIPQIQARAEATRVMVGEGFFLIMTGLVKKVIIADYISGNFVDRIFENPSLYSGIENIFGTIGFTIQLYCDFSGYSDMAIGIALLLGYRFKDNFNSPFKSQSPTEFWRRWHISLSTWLRDYIYIPLGGNRCSQIRMYTNLMLTMVIGGLWHGASWMYIIWGAYHGALLAIHKLLHKIWHTPQWIKNSMPAITFNITLTFVLVVIGFAVFRAPSMETLGDMLNQITESPHWDMLPQIVNAYPLVFIAIITGLLLHMSPHAWTIRLQQTYAACPAVLQAIILAAVIFAVIQTRSADLVPFVYLQY